MDSASFDNTAFRYRNDDGSETTATWVYAKDTNGDLNTDKIYRMRIVVGNTTSVAAANKSIQWEYNWSGAPGWNSVGITEAPIVALASKDTSWTLTEGDDTTQQVGTGTFVTPNACYTEDGGAGGVSLDFPAAASNETETELCFYIPHQQVNDNDTIQLRATVTGETNSYTTTPTISVNNPTCPADQVAFRFRDDDGSEAAATWLADQNVNISRAQDTNTRIRFEVDYGGDAANSVQFAIQYNKNGGGWNDVTAASTNIRLTDSANFISGDNTTNQLTAGAGSFVAGEMQEATGTAGHTDWATPGGGHTEWEFCFQVRSADTSNGDTIQLRAISEGDVLSTYTVTPTLTVSAGVTTIPVAAAVNASASTTAALRVDYALATAPNVTSPATAALTVNHRMSAAVSASAAVTGALSVFKLLAASINTASGTTAALRMDYALATAVNPAASVAAALRVDHALFANVQTGAGVTANLFGDKPLAAAISASASAVAALSVVKPLVAAINATASTTANLLVIHNMAAAIGAGPQVTANLFAAKPLAAAVSAAAAVTAALDVFKQFTAAINPTTSVTATLLATHNMLAAVAPVVNVTADLTGSFGLAAAVNPTVTVTAGLTVVKQLATAVNPAASVTANAFVTRYLQTAVSGGATATAALRVDYALATAITPSASVAAGLSIIAASPITPIIEPAMNISSHLAAMEIQANHDIMEIQAIPETMTVNAHVPVMETQANHDIMEIQATPEAMSINVHLPAMEIQAFELEETIG